MSVTTTQKSTRNASSHFTKLLRSDLRTIFVYCKCLEQIEDEFLKKVLGDFKHELEKHVCIVSELILSKGLELPLFAGNELGAVWEDFNETFSSDLGVFGNLLVLVSQAALNHLYYSEALSRNLSRIEHAHIDHMARTKFRQLEFLKSSIKTTFCSPNSLNRKMKLQDLIMEEIDPSEKWQNAIYLT